MNTETEVQRFKNAMTGLSTHDLLVQLVLARETDLVKNGALDAEATASLIEEVLAVAGDR